MKKNRNLTIILGVTIVLIVVGIHVYVDVPEQKIQVIQTTPSDIVATSSVTNIIKGGQMGSSAQKLTSNVITSSKFNESYRTEASEQFVGNVINMVSVSGNSADYAVKVQNSVKNNISGEVVVEIYSSDIKLENGKAYTFYTNPNSLDNRHIALYVELSKPIFD